MPSPSARLHSLPTLQFALKQESKMSGSSSAWIFLATVLLVSTAPLSWAMGPARCGPQSNYAVCVDSMCCSVDGFCGYSKEFCMDRCQSQCVDVFTNTTADSQQNLEGRSVTHTESSSARGISTESQSIDTKPAGTISSRKMNPANQLINNKMIPANQMINNKMIPANQMINNNMIPANQMISNNMIPANQMINNNNMIPANQMINNKMIPASQMISNKMIPTNQMINNKMIPASQMINNKMMSNPRSTIMTSNDFTRMFPNKNAFYTYDSLMAAMQLFPEFANSKDISTQKRELAAFLAHIEHETNGLAIIDESSSTSNTFCDSSKTQYPCMAGKSYHARGPLQMTWNYNYGMASKALGADLLAKPEIISQDPIMSFGSAIWMWMTPTSTSINMGSGSSMIHDSSLPSCHQVMMGEWKPTETEAAMGLSSQSFGSTTFLMRGNLECGQGVDPSMQMQRAQMYCSFCRILGVESGHHLECSSMGHM